MNYLKFNAPKDSEPFKLLSIQASLHVTARQKNIQLLKHLAGKGVQFKDIRQYLLNEAKRCGLWEAGKKEEHYKSRAWYVAVVNFKLWLTKNFTDYNVSKVKAVEVKAGQKEAPREIIVRHEVKPIDSSKPVNKIIPVANKMVDSKAVLAASTKLATTVKVEEQGEIARLKALLAAKEANEELPEDKPGLMGVTPNVLPLGIATVVGKSDAINESLKPSGVINRPLEECLTVVQVQTIIFKNLSILGKKASELGAGDEFNLLMEKMGLIDEMLDLSGDLLPGSIVATEVNQVSAN